jgi:predicted dithiol-disulfide oxidoreductase (DUF899 family)
VSEWVPEDERVTRVSIDFEPAGAGHTRLRLVHDRLPDTDTYEGHSRGWESIVDKLAAHLGPGGDSEGRPRRRGAKPNGETNRTEGSMKGRRRDESPEYRKLRDELLQAELDLRDRREAVAVLRRKLPLDAEVEDFELREGPPGLSGPDEPIREVRLSELFVREDRPLVLMHFMFGKKQASFCPMCTMWADGYDGVVPHVLQRANFAVLVAGDVAEFRRYGRGRGWRHLRLLSAADSALKRDLGFEDDDGAQHPGVSVFVKRGGALHHSYSVCALLKGDNEYRGMDLLSPVWHFFDLLPEGRGDFFPKKQYED